VQASTRPYAAELPRAFPAVFRKHVIKASRHQHYCDKKWQKSLEILCIEPAAAFPQVLNRIATSSLRSPGLSSPKGWLFRCSMQEKLLQFFTLFVLSASKGSKWQDGTHRSTFVCPRQIALAGNLESGEKYETVNS
jgi:hypothetical protein